MEVAPGIRLIPGEVGGRPLQLYLLRGDERTVLLDSGCAPDPARLIFPYLASIGLAPTDVDLLINTHADLDHCGGNAAMKRANPDLLVTCGEADRPLIEDPEVMWTRRYNRYADEHGVAYDEAGARWIAEMLGEPQPVDFTWAGGETLRIGRDWVVEIHQVPGHTAGHLAVFDPARRFLFSGDAVHGSVYLSLEGKPVLCPTYVHVDTYLASIRYVNGLNVETLYSCHWPVKTGDEVAAFLAESKHYVELAERVVLEELGRHPGGLTLAEIIQSAGPRLGEWPRGVDQELVFSLAGHMDRLVAQARLERDETVRPILYRLRGAG